MAAAAATATATAKYYFLKTHYEKSRLRMVPLPGQHINLPDGTTEKVDETLNVQSDKVIRTLFPVGEHFGTTSLTKKAGFYEAGDVFPLSSKISSDMKTVQPPSEDMVRAYRAYKDREGMELPEPKTVGETSKGSSRTLLGSLMRNKDLQPPKAEDGFYVHPDLWYLLIRNVRQGIPTMLTGPTGTGKTEVVRKVKEALSTSLEIFDMGSMYDPISSLLGVHRLNKEGISEFDYAKFTHAVRHEGIILLDELSRAPVTTSNLLFPCLDSRKELPVEIAGGHDVRSIPIHEGVSFIATANIGGEYTGTNVMDRALVDRFFMVEMSYLTPEQEISILENRTKINKKDAQIIVKIANSLRQSNMKGDISSSVSTRHTLLIGSLVKDGFDLVNALGAVLLPLYEGSNTEGERAVVKAIFTSR